MWHTGPNHRIHKLPVAIHVPSNPACSGKNGEQMRFEYRRANFGMEDRILPTRLSDVHDITRSDEPVGTEIVRLGFHTR